MVHSDDFSVVAEELKKNKSDLKEEE